MLANGYVTEIDYPKHGKRLKVHGTPWQFSETPARIGIAPELGDDNDEVLARPRLHAGADRRFAGTKDHLTRPAPHPKPSPRAGALLVSYLAFGIACGMVPGINSPETGVPSSSFRDGRKEQARNL